MSLAFVLAHSFHCSAGVDDAGGGGGVTVVLQILGVILVALLMVIFKNLIEFNKLKLIYQIKA